MRTDGHGFRRFKPRNMRNTRNGDSSRVGLGRTGIAADDSPVPSIHSVRWVFPSTVGRRLSQKASLPPSGLLALVSLSPGPTMSRGLVALAGNPLTVSLVRFVSAVPQALGSARFIMPAPANATTA